MPKSKTKKFTVTYEYKAKVFVDVEAECAEDAEKAGLAEADESVQSNLSLVDVTVREKDVR